MSTFPSIIPPRSMEQRLAALAVANRTRSKRAAFKVALREVRPQDDAPWMAASVVLERPEWAESMRVWDLLISMPKFGQVKVGRMLLKLGISQSKRIGGLSERQRRLLVDELTSRAAPR